MQETRIEHFDPADAFPVDEWQTTQPSERAARIKRRLLENVRQIDVERARFTTESYRATEGEPMSIRRAKMLLHLVRCLSIDIHSDEIIVGNRSLLPRMGVIAPEGAVDWINKELDILPTRPQDTFDITPEQIRELREEIFPYWHGQALEDTVAQRVPADVRHVVDSKAFSLNQTDHAQGHILPDVEGWLRLGIEGLGDKVRYARTSFSATAQQKIFDESALIALDAATLFIRRYADLAMQQAEACDDATRRQELRSIAERCRRLSTEPAQDFWDALQAVWFLFTLLQIESNASSFSPGRFDQYMLPYLQRDLDSGALTLDQAQDLLELLWLKFNEIVLLRSSKSARYFAGFPIGFNIAIGGLLPDADGDADGDGDGDDDGDDDGDGSSDGTNLLSYMCLRAQANLGMTQPNLSIRIHDDSPDEFLRASAFVIGKGGGMPQVFNDEVIIPGQINRGIAVEDAQNYAVVGCVELSTPGKALGWSDASMFNLTRILELTLFGGRDPQSSEQIGPEAPTLVEMTSFGELEAAYDRQLAHFVPLMVKGCNVVDSIHAEKLPSPFLSLVIDDCIERGLDVTAGGAHYNFSGVQGVQIANVADSLVAVKQAIFDEGWISAGDLLEALRGDFIDSEVLRRRLINRAPKYGNDDPAVDQFAAKWGDRFCELVVQHPTIRGGTYQPGFYTVSAHVPMGANVGATPDGRHAGTPLADGGVSPMTGMDLRGATAVLNSVAAPNLELASNGTLLNMKFLPSFFDGDGALNKFVLLLRGFCQLKIPHVQFNVVNAHTLRSAQTNPTEFRSLVVRVAGYSAYFTELDSELQDEIIRRTEFEDA